MQIENNIETVVEAVELVEFKEVVLQQNIYDNCCGGHLT